MARCGGRRHPSCRWQRRRGDWRGIGWICRLQSAFALWWLQLPQRRRVGREGGGGGGERAANWPHCRGETGSSAASIPREQRRCGGVRQSQRCSGRPAVAHAAITVRGPRPPPLPRFGKESQRECRWRHPAPAVTTALLLRACLLQRGLRPMAAISAESDGSARRRRGPGGERSGRGRLARSEERAAGTARGQSRVRWRAGLRRRWSLGAGCESTRDSIAASLLGWPPVTAVVRGPPLHHAGGPLRRRMSDAVRPAILLLRSPRRRNGSGSPRRARPGGSARPLPSSSPCSCSVAVAEWRVRLRAERGASRARRRGRLHRGCCARRSDLHGAASRGHSHTRHANHSSTDTRRRHGEEAQRSRRWRGRRRGAERAESRTEAELRPRRKQPSCNDDGLRIRQACA